MGEACEAQLILFVLTVFTVFAHSFNIVGGLFGMNVGGVPFANSGNGFWSVIGFVTLLTGVAAYVVIRKRRN
jgi:zinc transporter